MGFNDAKAIEEKARLQKQVEGKIKCENCGNDNWEQFLYFGFGGGYFIAGCKQCAAGYRLHRDGAGGETWVKTHDGPSGPNPTRH